MTNSSYVFFSYSHKNSEQVGAVMDALASLGIDVRWDSGISAYADWEASLANLIQNAGCVVVFLTPEYVSSPFCCQELSYAAEKKLPILCVRLQETKLLPSLALILRSYQFIDVPGLQNPEQTARRIASCLPESVKALDVQNPAAPDVFISYSSEALADAETLAAALRKQGITCWIASGKKRSGSYVKQIMKALNAARLFVVIVTESAMASDHVLTEIDTAFNRQKEGMILCPLVLIRPEQLTDEFRYYLRRPEWFMAEHPVTAADMDSFAARLKEDL